ncbi:SlyX family protein [Halopseudomonas aestusnigri]|uniref:SlyX family protein n=1 Tax=Halopseudomonas aestusnigri TaxID=857252 RepID=UPI001E60F9FB|nr:SlyX family protein [Halopseudomonas aestusnigri]UGV31666.1 SlyX family protein [Halopseudomonas aestusnigri]
MTQDQLVARVDELETRLAFQDDTIQALNDALAAQQFELDRLRRSLELVAKRQADLAAQIPDDAGEEAPPPHY